VSSKKTVVNAAVPTVLFAGTLGVLIAVTVFGLARVTDQMLEAISVIPLHWGESHIDILADISLVASVPVVAWFSWWFFQKALVAEDKLETYRYIAPEK